MRIRGRNKMSLFFTKKSEVVKMVEESFGPSEDYLVVLKHNEVRIEIDDQQFIFCYG